MTLDSRFIFLALRYDYYKKDVLTKKWGIIVIYSEGISLKIYDNVHHYCIPE